MQDAILEATVEFILGTPKNLEHALHVAEAMPRVRVDLFRQVLEAVKGALEARLENNPLLNTWKIYSSYENDNKDFSEKQSYLALRKDVWDSRSEASRYTSGVQIITVHDKSH